ncbi:CPBP family intramembrane glutamic endopeptidase [Halobacillus salinus]|uniref:CPBP family intramembrane metalloprotease n=1 Tax=Halobacillus salinus TaxID=192814 RepID=A0A4Z0H6B2_9BACI|nr:CPBP family intramembrane metalloprotease [Halobacillus salinus]
MQMQGFSIIWPMVIYGSLVCIISLIPTMRNNYRRAFNLMVLKHLRTYLVMIAALLFIFFANLIIFNRSIFSTFDLITSDYSRTLLLDKVELFQYILYVVVVAPVIEEMLFRVPLSIWMNRLTYFIIALMTSCTIFAFLHPEYWLFGFILGGVFGVTYKITKSIVPVILIHVIWNVFALFYFNNI